jgi:hypothetical protein
MYMHGMGFGSGFIWFVAFVLMIIAMVKIYQKAGREWWEAIVPIYNVYVMLKVVGKPGWWIILYFIPLVNIIISIIVLHKLSKSFGKNGGFTAGLFFLPFIFYPILGFSDAQYVKPVEVNS